MSNSAITHYLESLGLIPTEVTLYLQLLSLDRPVTILELSDICKVARTTVHQNIETLIEKGLVTEVKVGARRKVKAERPFVLETFLEQQKIQIKRRFLFLKNLQKQLPSVLEDLESREYRFG